MKIITVGPLWRGSNAGGLFRAFSRQGQIIDIVDEFYFLSLRSKRTLTKIIEKLIRNLQTDEFNNQIKVNLTKFQPDVLFVYKGAFVYPETLDFAASRNIRIALFYPDVSMTFHGGNIPKCLPKYELIFTTKTFGINDLKDNFGTNRAVFVPHGFDPEIHRKIKVEDRDSALYACDASFIGTWSPKKEKYLAGIKAALPNLSLRIWGNQWSKSNSPILASSIMHKEVLGDLYAIAIRASKINLGILSERVEGASSGDLITSRTFHIPGCGGFMLHERNEESVLYFDEGTEVGFFDGEEELVEKVRYYLANEQERLQVAEAGYQRALRDHSLDERAKTVLMHMEQLLKP